MDSLSLNDYEFTTEFRPIKDSKGVEETREVALSVAKANTTINLDKDLNVHQLRKLVRKLGVTKGNLNKTECRYYMWKTKQELGTINHNLQQIPSTQCRVINVLFHRDFIVDNIWNLINEGQSNGGCLVIEARDDGTGNSSLGGSSIIRSNNVSTCWVVSWLSSTSAWTIASNLE